MFGGPATGPLRRRTPIFGTDGDGDGVVGVGMGGVGLGSMACGGSGGVGIVGCGVTGCSLGWSSACSALLGLGASSDLPGAGRVTTLMCSSLYSGGFSNPKVRSMSSRIAGIRMAKPIASVRRPAPMLSCSTLEVAGTGLRRRQSLVAVSAGLGAPAIAEIVGGRDFNKCAQCRTKKMAAGGPHFAGDAFD